MGNKIITEKDFWICTGGTTPAQLQTTQLTTKKESGHKYITVADTATSSWIDFGCRKLMWIMALLAAVIVVAVVATGGAALIAIGALAGAAGAIFGALVGTLICGQKAIAARKWLDSKPDMIIQGRQAITGADKMTCMLFGETIAFAPKIKNWWQAIALGASNYIGGILEGMMWGAAAGGVGMVLKGGMAALSQFGVSNLASNYLTSWTRGMGVGLRRAITAQTVLGAYGQEGEVTAGDVITHGVLGMETGTYDSAKKILTGNGTMNDVLGVGLWFFPAHGRNPRTRARTEEVRNEEARNEEARNEEETKNEENPQARGNESKAPRQKGEFEAYEEGKGKPWEQGRNPYRYRRYVNQFRRAHPDREPLGPEDWWNEHGKKPPHNPDGEAGSPEHQADVRRNNEPNNLVPMDIGGRRPDGVGQPDQTVTIRGEEIRPEPGGRVIVESDHMVYRGTDRTMPDSEARAQMRDIRRAAPNDTLVVTDLADPNARPLVYPPGAQPPPPGRLPPDTPSSVPYP